MADIRVSEYQTRHQLDDFVRGRTNPDPMDRIIGTTAELKRVHLSHGQSVYGIPVEASDYEQPTTFERPVRGEVYPFGLNGDLRDTKGKPVKKKINRKSK